MNVELEKIKKETDSEVQNWLDNILFYLTEYPEQRDLYADSFIASFTTLIHEVTDELRYAEDE